MLGEIVQRFTGKPGQRSRRKNRFCSWRHWYSAKAGRISL